MNGGSHAGHNQPDCFCVPLAHNLIVVGLRDCDQDGRNIVYSCRCQGCGWVGRIDPSLWYDYQSMDAVRSGDRIR
jgi:hypothetical protein